MQDANPVSTPLDPSIKFHKRTEDERPADSTLYSSLVGELNHLPVWSRADTSFAISILSKFLADPSEIHPCRREASASVFKGHQSPAVHLFVESTSRIIGLRGFRLGERS